MKKTFEIFANVKKTNAARNIQVTQTIVHIMLYLLNPIVPIGSRKKN